MDGMPLINDIHIIDKEKEDITTDFKNVLMFAKLINCIGDIRFVGMSSKQRPLSPKNLKTKTPHIFGGSEITISRLPMRLTVEHW